jgi:ADP-L-glycero-D-manno-heptose 6-epimerase
MTVKMTSQTYLVTGAAGFIGSRFVESCNQQGISMISVDQKSHFQDRNEVKNLDFGQIVDLNDLSNWLENHKPRLDAIIHLGAITDTRELDQALLKRLNLDYSKSLWNYASKHEIPFNYASSAATYGDGLLGYDDQESSISLLKPLNAYGESKRLFDLWALEEEKKGNHPPSWSGFKFFNVYGFGERHKGFMSSVVLHAYDQIQSQGKVTLFRSHRDGIADGYQKRDFVSVEDVVRVLHFAVKKPIHRGIFNLGTGQARPFIDLAKAVYSALGIPPQIEFVDTPVSIRDKYQYFTEAKMDRLRAEGYTPPFTSLEEGVKNYISRLKSQK